MTAKPTSKTATKPASRRAPVAEPVLQTSAKCACCLFARLVAVPNDDFGNASKMCECHVARPTFANLAPNI